MNKFLGYLAASAALLTGYIATPLEAEFSSARMHCEVWRAHVAGQEREISPPVNQALFSKIFLKETNYRRCLHGRLPLKDTPDFAPIALVHSDWMAAANTMSHTSTKPGWQKLGDRLRKTGTPFRSGLENVAAIHHPATEDGELFFRRPRGSCNMYRTDGSKIPPHSYASLTRFTIEKLMESPGHRANILSPTATHHTAATRLNYREAPCGRHFITQNFVEIPTPSGQD